MEAEFLSKIRGVEAANNATIKVPPNLDDMSAADVKIWLTAASETLLKEIRLRKAQTECQLRLDKAEVESAENQLAEWRKIASIQSELKAVEKLKGSGEFCPPLPSSKPKEEKIVDAKLQVVNDPVVQPLSETQVKMELPRRPNLLDYNLSEDLSRDLLEKTAKLNIWGAEAPKNPFDGCSTQVTPGIFDGRLLAETSEQQDVPMSLLAFRKGDVCAGGAHKRLGGGLKDSTGSMNGSLTEDNDDNDTLMQLFPRGKFPTPDFSNEDVTATVPVIIPTHIVPLPSSTGPDRLSILPSKPKPPVLLMDEEKKKVPSGLLPPRPVIDGDFKRPMVNPIPKSTTKSSNPTVKAPVQPEPNAADLNVTYVVGNEKFSSKRLHSLTDADYEHLDWQTKSVLPLPSINDAIGRLNAFADVKGDSSMAFGRSDLPKILSHFNGVQILSFIRALSHSGRLRTVRPKSSGPSVADQTVFLG